MITWFVAMATLVLATATLLPTLPFASGFVRVCDFPRLQIGAAALLLLALTAFLVPVSPVFWGLAAIQTTILAVQAAVCLRFTPLHRKQSKAYRASEPSGWLGQNPDGER